MKYSFSARFLEPVAFDRYSHQRHEDSNRPLPANNAHTARAHITMTPPDGNPSGDCAATCETNVAREQVRGVKLDDTLSYRTSARAERASAQIAHSSRGDGNELFCPEPHTHSPRHLPEGIVLPYSARQFAAGNGWTARYEHACHLRWPGIAGWHRIAASEPPP